MRLAVVLWALVLTVPVTGAQSPGPLFRSGTELVRITATVANTRGEPVMDLGQAEFVLTDNGAPQEIALFAQDAATHVSVLMLLDASGSMDETFPSVRDGLKTFVTGIRDDDQLGLMTFADQVQLVTPLDGSREALMHAMSGLRSGGRTALYDGIVQGLRLLQQARHHKRVLMLLTDGNDTKGDVDRGDAVAAFERSDAMVYGIGLGHGSPGSFLSLFDRGRMRVMRSFAGASGGRAELVPNPGGRHGAMVSEMIAAYGRELHQQYTLGYYPSTRGQGREKHEVRVEVKRPGMIVRARSVYRRR